MNIFDIAKICHEANASLCETHGDDTQEYWEKAPEWQRKSAVAGVEFHLANSEAGDSASHDNWAADKISDGWTFGEIKDPDVKTHPCLVPFDELPMEQQAKDALFRGIVHSLKPFMA
jgi:hypothetical protein